MKTLPPGVSIRKLLATHLPQLAEFSCANPGEEFTSVVQDVVQALCGSWLSPNSETESLVAVAGTEVVGVIAFEPGYARPDIGYVHVLAVKHGWRRRGIGTTLKEETMRILVYEYG